MPQPTAPRVLIVDDEEDSRNMAASYLASAGWTVRVMERSNDALAVLSTRGFDAILLDLCLDGVSPEGGIRVAETLRASGRHTNIVVLSGYAVSDEQRERVLKSANVLLEKPQPMQVVERALRGPRRPPSWS